MIIKSSETKKKKREVRFIAYCRERDNLWPKKLKCYCEFIGKILERGCNLRKCSYGWYVVPMVIVVAVS